MVTELLKSIAAWVLRKELDAAKTAYINVQNKLYKTEQNNITNEIKLTEYQIRAAALTEWFKDSDYLRSNNLVRFAVDYISQGAYGEQGVHPALRWGIPGSQGWGRAYGRG